MATFDDPVALFDDPREWFDGGVAGLLQDVLAPLATIAVGGLWNLRAAQNTPAPYIVWQRIVAVINNSTTGASNLQNARVQIDAYAPDALTAATLGESIQIAMAESAINNVCLSAQDFYEDDTHLYRVSQDFSLWLT